MIKKTINMKKLSKCELELLDRRADMFTNSNNERLAKEATSIKNEIARILSYCSDLQYNFDEWEH